MSSRRRGFTLLEVLVVISIISVLVALLLPLLSRIRRKAAVLASPIGYTTWLSGITLVHPTGRAEVDFVPSHGMLTNGSAGPVWSLNGRWLGYARRAPGSSGYQTVIVNPATNELHLHDGPDTFVGWADDNHFIQTGWLGIGTRFVTCDAETGAPSGVAEHLGWLNYVGQYISPLPPGGVARYAAAYSDPEGMHVVLLRQDFSIAKAVWVERSPGAGNLAPRVDPLGEYIAWTARATTKSGTRTNAVALKSLKDPSSRAPDVIADQFEAAYFSDWNEEGLLLVTVQDGTRNAKLMLFDRNGRLVREVPTSDDPRGIAAAASWRKHWRL